MGSLLEIKKKIGATKNTRKITKAMKLVAGSKMKFFQKKAVSSREYALELLNVLHNNLNETNNSSLMEKRTTGKSVFILYTSDKGLCGALNSRIIKALVNSKEWKGVDEKDRILITIGKKSFDYAKYNGIEVAHSFNSLNEKLTILDAIKIIDVVMDYWNKHNVKEVRMVAPHYKNSLVFYPVMKTYLPFSSEMVSQHLNVEDENDLGNELDVKDSSFGFNPDSLEPPMIYEPNRERFTEVLIEQVVNTLFLQSFFELKAAEYSNRMLAMQNATDAASDLIDRYTLQYNKARQSAITQEIAELVGGSMT